MGVFYENLCHRQLYTRVDSNDLGNLCSVEGIVIYGRPVDCKCFSI